MALEYTLGTGEPFFLVRVAQYHHNMNNKSNKQWSLITCSLYNNNRWVESNFCIPATFTCHKLPKVISLCEFWKRLHSIDAEKTKCLIFCNDLSKNISCVCQEQNIYKSISSCKLSSYHQVLHSNLQFAPLLWKFSQENKKESGILEILIFLGKKSALSRRFLQIHLILCCIGVGLWFQTWM